MNGMELELLRILIGVFKQHLGAVSLDTSSCADSKSAVE
jgi:ABC-type transport system involved in cytochrome c biogenesis ATPase subunit